MAKYNDLISRRWEEIKPKFLQLYQDENKSLAEVRQELEENHHFKASKSAFTRQIEKWNAFKNYKAQDKQYLTSQRIQGQRPYVDLQGRPVKWDRVYRATRAQRVRKSRRSYRVDAFRSTEFKRALSCAYWPLSQPIEYDSHALSCVVDIWRHSTLQFALKDPSAPSYLVDYSRYGRLMQSMAIITLPSQMQWPKLEIDSVCDAIPALLREQPAMTCDLLNFLTTRGPSENIAIYRMIKNQLFDYIRRMSCEVLPETSSFRCLICNLRDRESLTRLGAAIAKAKLDTMWNTSVVQAGRSQHQRPFFRQVLIKAILVVMDYEELECASTFLKKLSAYGSRDPFYLAACARLYDQRGETNRQCPRERSSDTH